MKKIILSALAIASLQLAVAQAQPTAASTPAVAPRMEKATPEQLATRQSTHLQKVLTLTDEQKQKVYQAALTRSTAMQQIKAKAASNRKELHAEAKPVREQYVKDVNATLTPEQQQKWQQYREAQKQKAMDRKHGQAAVPATTMPPAKLEPQDDGINDN